MLLVLVLISLVFQMVKPLPAMRETWVQSLGQEDPLEKGIAITPVLLPGKSHGQRSLVGYSPWSCRVGHDWVISLHWYEAITLVAQRLKCLLAMQETLVRSLGWEDPLEKEMATHSSILAWRIPWMEEPGGLQSTGHKELDTTERLHFHFHYNW